MKTKKTTNIVQYIILWIGLIFWVSRLFYFLHSNIPLWYDPGMYKEIFSHYRNVITSFDFSVLPQRIRHEPLLGILAALINKLWVSFDWLVTRWIWIINLIPGLLLFRWLKKHENNGRWWVFVAVLYWVSITQYDVFWSGYFKQILWVSVLLIVLFLGEQKKFWLQGILFFLLILLHKHTALYTGWILAISTIVEWIQTKKLPRKKIIIRFSAGVLALLCYIPLRGRIMTEAVKAVWEGTGGDFMSIWTYLSHTWPILILSILGFVWRIKDKKIDVWTVGYILGIIRIGLSLVNYNRTLVFFDVFVVIFAGYFLCKLYQDQSIISKISVYTLLAWWCIYYIWYLNSAAKPLINKEEFASIQNLSNITEKNAIIISTHRNYTPRIMWRSQRDYINPGMADLDKRTHNQRNQRWMNDGNFKCTLLKNTYTNLARPLYLWMWQNQFPENLSWWNCFQMINSWSTRTLYKIILQ